MKSLWVVLLCGVLKLSGTELSPADWNNRGSAFYAAHRYGEAESCFDRAWQLQQKEPGADEVVSATILTNLAATRRVQARYPEAEQLYLQALRFREAGPDPAREGAAITLKGLTILYLNQGKNEKAEEFGRRALAFREKHSQSPGEMADALNILCLVLLSEGRFDEAEVLAGRALDLVEGHPQQFGEQLGAALNTLGRVGLARSQWAASEQYFQRAARATVQALGAQSASTAAIWNNLGKAKAA